MSDFSKDTLTWLHLSDFHFKEKAQWQADVVLDSLIRDVLRKLPELGLAPDAVFITGDIAQSGKEAEYQTAMGIFAKMAAVLGHDPREKWYLVPGNHDVHRNSIDDGFKAFRKTIQESNINEFLATDILRKGLVARQEAFFRFTEKFLGSGRKWDVETPWKTEYLEVGNHVFAILCLNSAWLCQDDDDEGKLVISEYQMQQLLKVTEKVNPTLKIALAHHPLEDLQKFDGRRLKKILNSKHGCQFFLRGHLHETDLSLLQNPSAGALHLAAGACWQGSENHHSVSLVRLDLAKGNGAVHVWMYSGEDGGFWTPDTRLYQGMPKGIWEFELPESWGLARASKGEGASAWKGPLVPSR